MDKIEQIVKDSGMEISMEKTSRQPSRVHTWYIKNNYLGTMMTKAARYKP